MRTWEAFLFSEGLAPNVVARIIELGREHLPASEAIRRVEAELGVRTTKNTVLKLWKAHLTPEDLELITKNTKEAIVARNKAMWADPAHRERVSQMNADPEFKAKQAEIMRKKWEDPEYRQAKSQQAKAQWEDPEFQALKKQQGEEQWGDEDYRQRMSQLAADRWTDPEYRAKMRERNKRQWDDPTFRAAQTERMKQQSTEMWADPAHREAMSQRMIQHWEELGWWDWLAEFPVAKRIQIITKMFEKTKNRDGRPNAPLQAMINKAMSL